MLQPVALVGLARLLEQPVPKPRPKTADELRALVEPILARLPPKEQRRFLMLMADDPRNTHYHQLLAFVEKTTGILGELATGAVKLYADEASELAAVLKKHRKPIRNAARDAEIMRLHGEKKSSAKIAQLLRGRWKVTSGAVRLVTSRQKPKTD